MRTLLLLALPPVLCGAARAQLVLPDRPVPQAPPGADVHLPPVPRGNLRDRVVGGGLAPGRELRLPGAAPRAGAPAPDPGSAAEAPAPGAEERPLPSGFGSAAGFVLDELARVRRIDAPLVAHAADSLLALGDEGRAAAALALGGDHGPALLAGARVLLRTGQRADAERVVARLRRPLPASAAAALLDLLVRLDPVSATPQLLAELLGHGHAAVRGAAQAHLAALPPDARLAVLPGVLASRSVDARLRAVQLAAETGGPGALDLLLRALEDRSATVARRAVLALAHLESERVEPELLRRAFELPWILRTQAYALLAIVEREDRLLQPILGDAHAEPLLRGLTSSDAFLAGTCAAALAGIGFRSDAPEVSAWLDREVPHRLVRVVAGRDFHNDFSALQETAARRLGLLCGVAFGADGPRWLAWWTGAAEGFRARRAVLPATLEDAPRLKVSYVAGGSSPRAFELLGPAHAPAHLALPPAARGASVLLSEQQARELFELLRREQVFSGERLPGARVAAGPGRSLELILEGRSKGFRFPLAEAEPWFERCAAAVEALHERGRWQRYADPAPAGGALEAWRAEAAWWDAEHDDAERARRLVERVLTALPAVPPSQRDEGLADLAARSASLRAEDFVTLVALLEQERFVGPRARALVELAQRSTVAASGPLEPVLAARLIDAIVATFGAEGAPQIAAVLQRAGREALRGAAEDPRPLVRAIAAAGLAREPEARDLELLRALLRDPQTDVQRAALLAIGEGRIEEARTEVAVRARLADPPVRAAALRAIGRLGGDSAFDVLLEGLTQRASAEVSAAAAEGLTQLGDPRAASLFVSMLGRGGDDPVAAEARKGLLALGPQAWHELERAMHSPAHRGRRDAALLLARQGLPRAAPVLMMILTESPADARVAQELAVLTCVDLRGESAPSQAWWAWWDAVVHDDSLAWLCGALSRLGVAAPPPDALRGEGTREGLRFLADVLARDETHLAERARRELERLRGPLSDLPPPGEARRALAAKVRGELEAARE